MSQPARSPSDLSVFPEVARPRPAADGRALAQRLENKYLSRITGVHTVPGRPERSVPMPEDVPAGVVQALAARGIDRLYSHQADCWHAVRRGEDVVIATATASGKSLCYLLPVLAAATQRSNGAGAKALFLFPTKALAQD